MGFGNNEEELRLDVGVFDDGDGFHSSSTSVLLCRICHEEEDESSSIMESPCSCSGSLKFAHRDCIQRWCDEKGSIVCEICLQKFEPGYSVPPKLALLDIAVTIRGSLEVPRLNYEYENTEITSDDESENESPHCSPPSDKTATFFRSLTLIFMFIILARHLIIVISTGEGHYPFALATVLLLRASGIVLPFYFIMKIIAAIQKGQRQHQRRLQRFQRREAWIIQRTEGDEQPQHMIQIHS